MCRTCGTVQQLLKFESNTPFNEIQFRTPIIKKTTIGNEGERKMASDGGKMQVLSKLDAIIPYSEKVLNRASSLADTILEKLGRSKKDSSIILRKFIEILPYIPSGTTFRNPEKCIPCIIYFQYKEMNIVIDLNMLLEISAISKSDLKEFRKRMWLFWPGYETRDRKKYILTKIGSVTGYGKLYKQSKNILDKFWEIIKDSKDEILAGLVIGISITLSKSKQLTLRSISNSLNISQSSLQNSIQRKLFDRLGIENKLKGFKKRVEFLEERGFFRDE